jgi:hypothetical protein
MHMSSLFLMCMCTHSTETSLMDTNIWLAVTLQHLPNGSRKAEQQDVSPDAQLDKLLAEGKLLDAVQFAVQQQQELHASAAGAGKSAAGVQAVVAVHAYSSTTEETDAAADAYLLQEQQQPEQQLDLWQVGSVARKTACTGSCIKQCIHSVTCRWPEARISRMPCEA